MEVTGADFSFFGAHFWSAASAATARAGDTWEVYTEEGEEGEKRWWFVLGFLRWAEQAGAGMNI